MILQHLRDLNLFPPPPSAEQNEYQHRSGRIATRIYLIAFVLVLISTSIGLWLTPVVRKLTISNPTEAEFRALPIDAQCSCSQLSFPYGSFLSVDKRFHQVCTSDFVSDRWIRVLFFGARATGFYPSDIRAMGSAQFQTLAGLCRLAQRRFQDGLDALYATQFISTKVLYEDLFKSTIEAVMLEFHLTVPTQLQSQLHLINEITFGNQLTPAMETTFDLYYFDQLIGLDPTLYTTQRAISTGQFSYCRCMENYACTEQSGIYSLNMSNDVNPSFVGTLLLNITGFLSGCTPVTSLLQSTLQCFYNQTCVDVLLTEISNQESFTALAVLQDSRFPSNTTVQAMIDRLMLEEVTYNASYGKYFAQCKPRTCTYTTTQRHDGLYILAKIIGLLGGLTLTLGLIVPGTVRFVRNRRVRKDEPKSSVPLRVRLAQWTSRGKQVAIELNLFKSSSNGDDYALLERRISRLFLLLVVTSLLAIIIYLLSTEGIYRETVADPNESTYNELKRRYVSQVDCPCTKLSTTYEEFVSITPIYHPICSSDFISPEWLDFLAPFAAYTDIDGYQYQTNFLAQFKILATFCTSTAQAVEDARRVLLRNQYVTAEVTDEQTFQTQMASLIEHWKWNTQNQYARLLQLIHETNQGNKLVNYLSNVNFRANMTDKVMYYAPLNYSSCSCDLFGSCTAPIYYQAPRNPFLGNYDPLLVIRNFFMGCYPVEALRQSTLECLANQTCLDQVIESALSILLTYNVPMNFTVLNMTDEQAQEPIGTIIDRLMVDAWVVNTSFSAYYRSCAPICTYEYRSHQHVLIVFSTIIGVFGGLARGLRILISIAIILLEHLLKISSFNSVMQFIKSTFSITNEQTRISRLHFLLLLCTLTILYLASFLPLQTKTIQIDKPTLSAYEKLTMRFPENMECSCSKVSIDHGTYATIKPRFHPICSSDFVSDAWIIANYHDSNEQNPLGQYQLLKSLCQLAEKTVNLTLSQLLTTNDVRTQLLSLDALQTSMQQRMDEFETRTARSFIHTLDLIRETTAGNMLMNLYASNWQYEAVKLTSRYWDYRTVPVNYDQCQCGLSSTCSRATGNGTTGCYPLEVLLQSTLDCFYDQQCIDFTDRFRALGFTSNNSRFYRNATVQSLLEKLFVEEYRVDISYENYFNQCALSTCSYMYRGNANPIDTAVMLIELLGGLSIVSHWITLAVVMFYQHRRKTRPSTVS